ncbi:flavin reductase family protein [Sphingobium baderi]|nr:hypothetical protein ATN00_00835 [Sphingobium baderi]ARR53399.1 hypothetical protein HY78_08145 [Rhizorhabdus wittichii DC-6]
MRRLAGGVALVTARDDWRRYGMPMTAVMSLCMEPPSLVMAVNRSASIFQPLHAGRAFCVNLLKHHSAEMCQTFSSLPSEERFSVGQWGEGPHRTPYLLDAQAAIFCDSGPIHDFGTHSLIIGLVSDAWVDEHISPLIHLDGRYMATEERSDRTER